MKPQISNDLGLFCLYLRKEILGSRCSAEKGVLYATTALQRLLPVVVGHQMKLPGEKQPFGLETGSALNGCATRCCDRRT